MAEFNTLITDIYDLFKEDIPAFDISVSHENRSGDPTLRMSNLGRPLRQLWYELTGAPAEELPSQVKFKFGYGNILEDMVMALAEKSGHTVTDIQREVEVDGVPGHIDGAIDGVLVDIKSASPFGFDKFEDGTLFSNDPFGYVYQLSSYWACLPEYKRAAFIAIDKVSGRLCVLELNNDRRKSRESISERISEVRTAVSQPVEPDRCYDPVPISKTDKSGSLVLGVGCSYCLWKDHCWRDANDGAGLRTFIYSTGPKFFTTVGTRPRVNEITPFKVQES